MIKKRDGRQVPFNIEKIANAIFKAAQTVGGKDYSEAMELADRVCQQLSEEVIGRDPSVEEVQDMVERVLVEQGHAKTAKAYILYRADRTRAREMNSTLMKIYEDLTFMSASDCDIKRENANIDGDTAMGTMLKYGSEGAKQFNEMYVLDPKHSQAHINGDIHIHDLDFLTLTTTCCQIDLLKLFHGGFSTGHGYLREPNDISSYAALACIAIQSNQNDQHGGQSVPIFDYAMAEPINVTLIAELALLIVFSALCSILCTLLGQIIKSSLAFDALIPVILLFCLLYSPVLIDLGDFIPGYKVLSWLAPTKWYFALHNFIL